jgi:hypothetical protein
MANIYSQRTYDNALLLKAAGLVASTTTESVILDLGAGLVDADLVIDVSAIEVATGDEKYTIHLEGSNVAAMSSGSVTLANIPMGNKTDPADAATGTGRFIVPFRNEQNGATYRYVRIYTLVAGTVATGINFMAFIAKDED